MMAALLFLPNTVFGSNMITIDFNGTEYMHRGSENTLHEFTPAGQEDLTKWKDMISVNFYPTVNDGEELAKIANNVLNIYESNGAQILRTASLPRTPDRAAEHLTVAIFGRPSYFEFAQVRFKIIDGVGVSIVYSHRIYGSDVATEIGKWIQEKGPGLEEKLLSISEIPTAQQLDRVTTQ